MDATETRDTRPTSPAGVETRSIDYVPVSERHGKVWHLGPLWFAGNAQLATIAIGAFGIVGGLSFSWSILAIVIGAIIGTLFMAFHSAQGPKLGLPQMIQSRPQFGYYGALLPVVVAVLLFIGFNVFNTQLAGITVAETLNINATAGAILMAVLSFIWAIFGYRLIHRFCQWASVLFIVVYVLFGIGLAVAVRLPAGFYSFGTFKGTPFLLEMGAILSYQLTWAPYVSEYSRYLPRRTTTAATFWWTYIGSGIGILWLAGLGAFLAAAYPKIISPVTAIHVAGNSWFHGCGLHRPAVLVSRSHRRHRPEHVQRGPVHADDDRHHQADQADADAPGAIDHLHRCRWNRARDHDPGVVPHQLLVVPHDHPVLHDPVDGGEPGRLLLRPQGQLRDQGDLQAQRHVPPVGCGAASPRTGSGSSPWHRS